MPKPTNILLIRRAEKPLDPLGPSLTTEGLARAQAYVEYFQRCVVDQAVIKLDYLFAAANSIGSNRST